MGKKCDRIPYDVAVFRYHLVDSSPIERDRGICTARLMAPLHLPLTATGRSSPPSLALVRQPPRLQGTRAARKLRGQGDALPMPSGSFWQLLRPSISSLLRRMFGRFLLSCWECEPKREGVRRAPLRLPQRLWRPSRDRRGVREMGRGRVDGGIRGWPVHVMRAPSAACSIVVLLAVRTAMGF